MQQTKYLHLLTNKNGPATLAHIVFKNGVLMVPKRKTKFAKDYCRSIPSFREHRLYAEQDQVAEAVNELEDIELEIEALNSSTTIRR